MGMTRACSMLILTGVRCKPSKPKKKDEVEQVMKIAALEACLLEDVEENPHLAELKRYGISTLFRA